MCFQILKVFQVYHTRLTDYLCKIDTNGILEDSRIIYLLLNQKQLHLLYVLNWVVKTETKYAKKWKINRQMVTKVKTF